MYAKMTISITCPDDTPLSELKALAISKGHSTCRAEHIRNLKIYFPRTCKRRKVSFWPNDRTDHAAVLHSTQHLPTIIKFLDRKFPSLQTLTIRTHCFYNLFAKSGVPHDYVLHPLCCALPRLRSVTFQTDASVAYQRSLIHSKEPSLLLDSDEFARQRHILHALSWVFNHNLQRPLSSTMVHCCACNKGMFESCPFTLTAKCGKCILDPAGTDQDAGQIMSQRMVVVLKQMGFNGSLPKLAQGQKRKRHYSLRSLKWEWANFLNMYIAWRN